MIVVVEGPDGAGKSTLIDNLRLSCDRHYLTLRRNGPPKDVGEISSCVRWVEKAANSVTLMLDRHPLISEPIYGGILRGSNLLEGTYNLEDIRAHFLEFIDRVVYCRPPTSVIVRKMHDNPQLQGVVENIYLISKQYDYAMEMLKHWGVNVIEYDWTNEGSPPIDFLFFGNGTQL